MGGDSERKADKKHTSTDKAKPQKQHSNYSKLESGGSSRISAEDLGNLVADADTAALEKYGGVKGIAGALGTDLERGLSEGDLEEKKSTYGENRPPKKAEKSFFHFVWDALQDKTLIILAVCAGISIGLGVTVEDPSTGWIDGTAILAAVVIVVMVTAGNDFSKDKKFRKLSEIRDEKQITVVRDGEQKSISFLDALVGDIVELEPGAPIPADGLYLSGQDVTSDESAMTGEADSVHKNEEDPFMLSGCTILEGVCQMLVVAVGENSQKGKISALLDTPNEDTPLTQKLENLANQIGKFGLVAAVLTLGILIVKYVIDFLQNDKTWAWSELGILVKYLISAITIVVVAVPEGLPLAVTISLAYSMMKMMKDQNLVRHLEACETMGGATNICSDKTGTLTQNRMTVSKVYLCGEEFGDEGDVKEMDEKITRLFTEGIAINSNAYLSKKGKEKEGEEGKGKEGQKGKEPPKKEKKSKEQRVMEEAKAKAMEANGPKMEFVGSKTECALLEFMATKMDVNYEEIRKKHKHNIAKLYPFSSDRKMMSTAIRTEEGDAKFILYCKGASEIVLESCESILETDGESRLKKKQREDLSNMIEEYASSGLRTIGLAYKEYDQEPNWDDDDEIIHDLTFLGIAGIMDPVRNEVPDAVAQCKKAGIIVRMITGDNILTAKHIAKECGILDDEGLAIEGPKFRKMSDSEIDQILPKLQVIARAQPADKYKLVHRLRELGEVVAVTGDGVNDAPQLKEADVGFAMGITGTEVAKDASDIVLLDDNFSSIVKAVLWGRNVYDSIRKFIQFQLTVNIVAVAIAFIGSVTNGESPLTPVQLLWVNLIMDTFAALALSTERPNDELLDRKPYGRYDKLITRAMWRNIISQAIFQMAVLLVMLYAADIIPFINLPSKSEPVPTPLPGAKPNPDEESPYILARNTFLFNTFVMCQLFNEINARKLGNEINVFSRFFQNPVFVGVLIFTIIGQFLLVQFAGAFARTVPLSAVQWLVSIGIGAFSIPYGMVIRAIIRLKEPEPIKPSPEEIKKEHEKQMEKTKKKGDNKEDAKDPKKDMAQISEQIKTKQGTKGKREKGKDEKGKDGRGKGREEKDGKTTSTRSKSKASGDEAKEERRKKRSENKDGEGRKKRTGDSHENKEKRRHRDSDSDEEGKEKTKKVVKEKKTLDSDDGKGMKKSTEIKMKDITSDGEGKQVKVKKERDADGIHVEKKEKKEGDAHGIHVEKKERKERKERKGEFNHSDSEEESGEHKATRGRKEGDSDHKRTTQKTRRDSRSDSESSSDSSNSDSSYSESESESAVDSEEDRKRRKRVERESDRKDRERKGKAPMRTQERSHDHRSHDHRSHDHRSDDHIAIDMYDEGTQTETSSERSMLLPRNPNMPRKNANDNWDVASNVLAEISVVNALRNNRRRTSIYTYPTKKDNVTLATHRRRMSRQLSARRQSKGNINN